VKHSYALLSSLLALTFAASCKQEKIVRDTYSTMRFDVLALPTAADTLRLTTVDFVSAREGFVGGVAGTLFATTDGGTTWTRRSQPALGTLNKLLFTSPTAGWAGTSTGLYRTSTGGQSWQAVPTFNALGGRMAVEDVQFVSPLVGYVVGSGGGICKTTNGGSTWTALQNRIDKLYAFRAVSFSSPDSGTVVGDARSFWTTTNGGQSWDFFDSNVGGGGGTTYDVLRANRRSYQLVGPDGFQDYQGSNFPNGPDRTFGWPMYGLARFGGRGGPIVAVGERTLVRYHPAWSLSSSTPWVNVHQPDGTSFRATYYAADFAEAGIFYAVGARGVIHRFYYE